MNEEQLQSMVEVLQSLFVVIKTVAAHGPDHPFSLEMSKRLAKFVDESKPPWKLQFIKGGIFRDLALLDLGVEGYSRAGSIGKALARTGKHEIELKKNLTPEQWLRFGRVLSDAMLRRQVDLESLDLPGLSFNAIANANFGEDDDEMDPELYAISQIALAMDDIEQIESMLSNGWPWRRAMSILRRLDRAIDSDVKAATRALELAPGGWTPSRRAASAAFDAMAVLKSLSIDGATTRVAGHVMLALGLNGYDEKGGQSMIEALPKTIDNLNQTIGKLVRDMLPPHPFKVMTTLQSFTAQRPDQWMGFMHLIQTVYQLELERVPIDASFSLTRGDLLALAAQEMGTVYSPSWVKMLIDVHGQTPPGAHVRMPDGRIGMVLGSQGKTIELLVMDRVVTLSDSTPLTLISSAEAMGLF